MAEPEQPSGGHLVPRGLRLAAGLIIGACLLVIAILTAIVVHGSRPTGLDTAMANFLQPRFTSGGFRLQPGGFGVRLDLGALAQLGGPIPMTFLTGLLAYCCLATRRYRGAVLLVASVVVAISLTEFVLKPVIGRTFLGGLSFPSGHSTAAFALAMSIVVLLADPAGTRMPRSLRVVLSLVALASAGGVALGLVAAHMHYFTDTVAGAAVGTTVALSTALIIDWVVARRASQKLAEPQPVELARLR